MSFTPNLPVVAAPATPPVITSVKSRQKPPPSSGEKAAIVLASIGPGPAAPMLDGVGPEKVQLFAKILSRLRPADSQLVDSVLQEFLEKMNGGDTVSGGADRARNFLAEILNPAELEQAMADLGGSSPSVWRNFSRLPEHEIRNWLMGEHPHVAALSLAQLPAEISAKLLQSIEPDLARDLVARMDKGVQASPALIGRIASAIETGFLPAARLRARGVDPAGHIASVMNHVPPDLREEILENLHSSKPDLARDVVKIMFTFENIPERVNPLDVVQIVRQIDEQTLLKALKGEDEAASDVAEFIIANVTSRLADRLRGDLSDMALPSEKETETSRATLVSTITAARDRGEIELLDPPEE